MPTDVPHILEEAGWHQLRQVSLPPQLIEECPLEHPSLSILSNFGGLHIGDNGPGIECPSSDVQFVWLCHYFDKNIAPWEALLQTKLIGVGEVCNGHSGLFVAQYGRCFDLSLVHDAFAFAGANITETLQRYFDGMRVQPMLRPDQESVGWYSTTFLRHSPELYKY